MGVGMSGMVSGLDTDSIVKAMVSSYTSKKEDLTKEQTKLQWKMDAWKSLNTKVYSFYSKTMSNMRFSTNYTKKTTSISDTSIAKISASSNSVNGTQSLAVTQLAKAGYLTGGKVSNTTDSTQKLTASSKLSDLGITSDSSFSVGIGGNDTTISVNGDTTIAQLVSQMKNAGVNASFDETNQRFFISAKDSGVDYDFTLTAGDSNGMKTLKALGLSTAGISDSELATYKKWAAYTDDELADVTAKDIETQYNKKKTTETAQKAALTSSINTLKSQNTALYQAQLLENIKAINGNSTTSDEISEYITNTKKDLEKKLENDVYTDSDKEKFKNELSAINAVESNLKDDDGNYSIEKVNDTYEKIIESLSLEDGVTVSEQLNANYTEISNLQNTIDNNLTEYTEQKNAEIKADITSSVTTSNANRRELAIAYMAQYDYQQKVDKGETVDTDTLTKYNDSVAAYGNLLGEADDGTGSGATRIYGQDAIIYLNGAKFQNNDNTITVNGLSITATETTGINDDGSYKTVSITTSDDTDAIYDMIRDFFSEYNSLINEMDKSYNAASSKGYEPLTDDEKEQMSDDEIEKWETKIKDSILRKDSTVNSVAQVMKTTMQKGIKIGDKTYYLSDFGIGTQSYFSAAKNEKSALHIDGDEEDSVSSGKDDKLKNMILTDPDTVVSFFSQLTTNVYNELTNKMKSTSLSSTYTLYNDKQMQSEYSQYTTKISDQEEKIKYWEDYYYSQFTAMEIALSKLNSQQSALSGLISS